MSGISEKVMKLLAKSRDAGASEAEAAACFERARALMEEHGLTEESLVERSQEPEVFAFPAKYQEPWRKTLAMMCGYSAGCVFIWRPRSDQFVFVGSASGVVVAHGTYKHLERIVTTLASAHRSATRGTRQNQLQFERGCAARVVLRLTEIIRAREKPRSGGEGALVLVGEYKRAEEWAAENTRAKEGDVGDIKIEGRSGVAGYHKGGEVVLGEQLR